MSCCKKQSLTPLRSFPIRFKRRPPSGAPTVLFADFNSTRSPGPWDPVLDPNNPPDIVVFLSEPVDPSTTDDTTVFLTIAGNPAHIAHGAYSFLAGNTQIQFTPTVALPTGVTYTVHVTAGLKNPLARSFVPATFDMPVVAASVCVPPVQVGFPVFSSPQCAFVPGPFSTINVTFNIPVANPVVTAATEVVFIQECFGGPEPTCDAAPAGTPVAFPPVGLSGPSTVELTITNPPFVGQNQTYRVTFTVERADDPSCTATVSVCFFTPPA